MKKEYISKICKKFLGIQTLFKKQEVFSITKISLIPWLNPEVFNREIFGIENFRLKSEVLHQ